ncbi:MAG: GNAT family N-acetyltransferase [Gammaproteobacteria bacterium]|nr:GNAT family N-acetyltransferase [Gammaproteobacteria bacterium]
MIAGDALPTLEAPRVRLRGLTERDVDALFAIFSDEVMMRFQWGVERNEDGEILGTCTLFSIHRDSKRAELGYCLRSPYWRKGYMSEALTALIDYAFATLKLRRLEADVDPGNAGSVRLLERMGFTREGLLRERWDVGGQIGDTAFFGLLAREWRGRPA